MSQWKMVAAVRTAPLRAVLSLAVAVLMAAPGAQAQHEGPDISETAFLCDLEPSDIAQAGLTPVSRTEARSLARPGALLRNRLFTDADLSGVDLTGADLTGSRFCGVDLSRARLANAQADGAVFAESRDRPGSIAGANFTDASLRNARIGAVEQQRARFDGADLRGAIIGCSGLSGTGACPAEPNLTGLSIARADLRGAFAPGWSLGPSVTSGARLDDAVFLPLPEALSWLSRSDLAADRHIRFDSSANGGLGRADRFSAAEVRRLVNLPMPEQVQVRAGFDCAKAGTPVERLICATPELSALDGALSWVWRQRQRSPADRTAQTEWLRRRNACRSDVACLSDRYAERIAQLGADQQVPAPLVRGAFFSEPPFLIAEGPDRPLLMRWAAVQPKPWDRFDIEVSRTGTARFSAETLGGGGHSCSAAAANMRMRGAIVRPDDGPDPGSPPELSVAFVITPTVIVRAGLGLYFCGARAAFPRVYHLWPDEPLLEP